MDGGLLVQEAGRRQTEGQDGITVACACRDTLGRGDQEEDCTSVL